MRPSLVQQLIFWGTVACFVLSFFLPASAPENLDHDKFKGYHAACVTLDFILNFSGSFNAQNMIVRKLLGFLMFFPNVWILILIFFKRRIKSVLLMVISAVAILSALLFPSFFEMHVKIGFWLWILSQMALIAEVYFWYVKPRQLSV